MSAYDDLQKKYGKDMVKFGSPCTGGKHTEAQGYKEITEVIDEATKTILRTNTAAARSAALEKYFLLDGKKIWIKTATRMGHARFWTETEKSVDALSQEYDENDPDDFDRVGENTASMPIRN